MGTNNKLKLSIIIPVYNRKNEVDELLKSLSKQTYLQFEVIIVEDGSTEQCDQIVKKYRNCMDVKYYFKENSGPGESRNYGFQKAKGNYCIFLDSDCILPPDYIEIIKKSLTNKYVDAFGGPDKSHKDFTNLQKAINYSMTSFFTTGGIRGGSEKVDKFYPRSFNMGYSRDVYNKTHGFSKMRFGEDIDMSIKILKNGFKTKLIKEGYVYHKRRTNLRQFFKQVFNSGIARINLYKRHPESLKLVHIAPAIFTVGVVFLLTSSLLWSPIFLIPLLAHIILIFLEATVKNKSIPIGFLAIISSFIQLIGYGLGFLKATWDRIILRKREFYAFRKSFYT